MQLSSNINPFVYGANNRLLPHTNTRNPFSQYNNIGSASPYRNTNFLNNRTVSPFRTNGLNPYTQPAVKPRTKTDKFTQAKVPTSGSLQESAQLFMSTMAVIMLQDRTNKTGKYSPEIDQAIAESLGVDLYGDELPNSDSSRAKKGLAPLPGAGLKKLFDTFSASA